MTFCHISLSIRLCPLHISPYWTVTIFWWCVVSVLQYSWRLKFIYNLFLVITQSSKRSFDCGNIGSQQMFRVFVPNWIGKWTEKCSVRAIVTYMGIRYLLPVKNSSSSSIRLFLNIFLCLCAEKKNTCQVKNASNQLQFKWRANRVIENKDQKFIRQHLQN